MEIKTIKRIDIMKFALNIGLISGVLGLVAGILVALFISAMRSLVPFAELSALMAIGGFVAIVAYPVMYFIYGFIGSAIAAILYNFIAPHVGGIKIEVE